jgi:tetratricopeptide (TPR) repeat protein
MSEHELDQRGDEEAPKGTLGIALEHTVFLLEEDPSLAEEQAQEIIRVFPDEARAHLLLAKARRRQGDAEGALAASDAALMIREKLAEAHVERGLALASLGDGRKAIKSFEQALSLEPEMPNAWRALGDQLALAGDSEAADRAYARHIKSQVKDPELMNAAVALADGRIAIAERLIKTYLKKHPTDVMAIRMLGEVAARIGRYEDAEKLLARCLELAPSFSAARHNYAIVLLRRNKPAEAVAEVSALLKADPANPNFRVLKSAALVRIGGYEEAIGIYEKLLKEYPRQPKSWMSFGHALKTVGRTAEAIDAYRTSIGMLPSLGEAYWSLANLKTFKFEEADIEAMIAQLERADIEETDRLHLHFALGKALEDAGRFEESFRHYEAGNALGEKRVDYDEDEVSMRRERAEKTYTRALFASREGQGAAAPDPIFILGMPRAGSTLIEQILSSHSKVEGTMELPDIMAIAKRLGGKAKASDESKYPEIVAELSGDELRALGEEYIEGTRIQRKTGKPFFIDKMPNNFMHIGLIRLILPNAKVIDARRHPLACCFSGYKQHFAHGQNFSYGLERIGRYYADYVRLMKHFDGVLPCFVHRVIYEDLVADTETEVRRLLGFCKLEFEPACLAFYETERAVRTASSEQVRQPIYTGGVEHWRHYEPWLGPLKEALGPVLEAYPSAP